MDLSIIIISFNTKDLLSACIKSVHETTSNLIYEIIVVDNGSMDGSIDMLAIEFPEVMIISNKANLGFSKANNQGINMARGKLILLLNSDTMVKNNSIESLVNFMTEQTNVAAVGPRVLNIDGTLQSMGGSLPSIGDAFLSLFRIPIFFPLELKKRLFPDLLRDENKISRVGWITGCCMMLSKDIINRIGPLDEDFFFYCEDVEWCCRAKKTGYHVYYYPYSEIIHYGGASNLDQPSQQRLNANTLMIKKCMGTLKGIILLILIVLCSITSLLIAVLRGRDAHEKMILTNNIRHNIEIINKLILNNVAVSQS